MKILRTPEKAEVSKSSHELWMKNLILVLHSCCQMLPLHRIAVGEVKSAWKTQRWPLRLSVNQTEKTLHFSLFFFSLSCVCNTLFCDIGYHVSSYTLSITHYISMVLDLLLFLFGTEFNNLANNIRTVRPCAFVIYNI